MPRVLLAGHWGSDPVGERSLSTAVAASLPEYEVVEGWSALSRAALGEAARHADGIVIAGQDLAPARLDRQRRSGATLAAAAALVHMARMSGRPAALLGVTVATGGSGVDRWLARRVVRRANLLLVSDEESAACLASAGAPVPVRVSADPAWLGISTGGAERSGGECVTVVLDGRVGLDVEAALLAALAVVGAQGTPIKLLPWAGPDSADAAMGSRLASHLRDLRLPVETVPSPMNLDDACYCFEDAGVVVTLRYRAIHAAATLGVPIIGVAVEGRIGAMARRLEQTSLEPRALAATLPSAIAESFHEPAPSPAAIKEEISRAESGFSLLRLVLERGDAELSEVDGLPLAPDPWLR